MDKKKVNPIQVQKYLKGTKYPAKKEDLVSKAKSAGADASMIMVLEKMPGNVFDTPAQVSKGISKVNSQL